MIEGQPMQVIQETVDRIVESTRAGIGVVGKLHGVVYESSDNRFLAVQLTNYEMHQIDRALYGDTIADGNYEAVRK